MNITDIHLMKKACLEAGKIAMSYFRTNLAVEYKADERDSPVTIADREVDAFIKNALLAARPHYGWLSEEDAAVNLAPDNVFVLDSIDGTVRFINGEPEFAIALGLVTGAVASAGVVYNPATDELFDSDTILPYQQRADLCLISPNLTREPHYRALQAKLPLKTLGSGAYKLAKLCAGDASSVVISHPLSSWDVAGPAALCAKAGIKLTDMQGQPLDLSDLTQENIIDSVVAAPFAHHDTVLSTVQQVIGR